MTGRLVDLLPVLGVWAGVCDGVVEAGGFGIVEGIDDGVLPGIGEVFGLCGG